MEFRLSVSRLFRWHLVAIVVLLAANGLAILRDWRMGGTSTFFRMAFEGNLPTFFSALAITAAAVVAWLLCRSVPDRRETRGWGVFALLLAFMAVDEAAQVHEKLNRFGGQGPDMFSSIGVLPYAVVALGLGAYLFGFWLRQSRQVRLGLAGGGALYVLSAVGLELIENVERAAGVTNSALHMAALISVEETGEMLAVAILLRAFLLRFTELGGRRVAVRFEPKAA